MRRLFLAILSVLFISSLAFAQASPGTGDKLGQGKRPSDPHKIFRYVRHVGTAGSSALAAGDIVIWDLAQDDGVSVATTIVSSDSAVAGVLATQILTADTLTNTAAKDTGKDNWGWLQTYGYATCDLATGLGNVLAGYAVGTSSVAGEMTACGAVPGTPNRQKCVGFSYDDATAAADDVEIFITGLD